MATVVACIIPQWRIQGGRRWRAPPYGSRFFRFDIQIFWNVAASGVGTPPYEVGAPLREILDPLLFLIEIEINISLKFKIRGILGI